MEAGQAKRVRNWAAVIITIAGIALVPMSITNMRANAVILILLWLIGVVAILASEELEGKPWETVFKYTLLAMVGWGTLFLGEYKFIEYETDPKLSGDILEVNVATNPKYKSRDESPDSILFIHMKLRNDGRQTVISAWRAFVSVPGYPLIEGTKLPMGHDIYHLEDQTIPNEVQFSGEEDDLAFKVKERAFGIGDAPSGFIGFQFFGLPATAVITKATLIQVAFADDAGNEGVAKYTMTGHRLNNRPGLYIPKGTKPAEPKQP